MGDYIDGKSSKRGSGQHINISHDVDVNAIAVAVAQALGKMPLTNQRVGSGYELEDTFNDEKSLSKLAESMIVQRGKNKSNFGDLGNIKETKKDEDVNKTIDLLKIIND